MYIVKMGLFFEIIDDLNEMIIWFKYIILKKFRDVFNFF